MIDLTNTYWNNAGKFQKMGDALEDLIPGSGQVDNPRKNRKLEKFRIASNAYYDLYNNGLCNRADEFRRAFFASTKFKKYTGSYNGNAYSDELYYKTEEMMSTIIMEAFLEQQANIEMSIVSGDSANIAEA